MGNPLGGGCESKSAVACEGNELRLDVGMSNSVRFRIAMISWGVLAASGSLAVDSRSTLATQSIREVTVLSVLQACLLGGNGHSNCSPDNCSSVSPLFSLLSKYDLEWEVLELE